VSSLQVKKLQYNSMRAGMKIRHYWFVAGLFATSDPNVVNWVKTIQGNGDRWIPQAPASFVPVIGT
jgi:hypothetical protein